MAGLTPGKNRSSTSRRVTRLRPVTSIGLPLPLSVLAPWTLLSESRRTVPVMPLAAATEVTEPGLVGSAAVGFDASGAA